ncbi:hypothetical protein ELZ88_24375 (plasmid) [Salmonella enterica subsp. enterica serovar Karamoja]|uniref:Uncharacterized protein n=1 Tax=Salmonella enterica subsp. enterica serovar Karamoja TaxID=2500153 RepID=A0A3Q9MPK9_SALET|nr:hypothetical protein [Salmonella enterica]AZT39670.1 hypothetical protein ELZ88_24375 [Salmonella enterica subsp. enterica serovar Karamoja]AZT44430.1 hypothetical protein EL007_24565 [Salmonella enterica subsp. enterica serovar Karamoja]
MENTMLSAEEMPSFNNTLSIHVDWSVERFEYMYVVARFYAPFGDGSYSGWQEPVTPPAITVNGIDTTIENWFPGTDSTSYLMGQQGPGFDQHAQYFRYYPAQKVALYDHLDINVSGQFQKAGYFSVVCYYETVVKETGALIDQQMELIDSEMTTTSANGNPYVINNPSVFYYADPEKKTLNLTEMSVPPATERSLPVHKVVVNEDTGAISFFRLDKDASDSVVADEVATDGCSKGYLFSYKTPEQRACILRIKVPQTFVESDSPDTTFGYYQTREFSIGANVEELVPPVLNFWTVSSRMLHDYIDEDGYAYVFFAPNEFVKTMVEEQQTPEMQPPLMTWGNYTGFVLGEPTFATILRYRVPSDIWLGSPINGVCYPNADALEPVTAEELGDYLPEMYGDTFENFLNGKIGAVNKDSTWPVAE